MAQFFDLHALQVRHPADGRRVIAAGRVGHRLEALERLAHRLVVGTQAALFLDDLYLAAELVGGQFQGRHAIGFQLQRDAQTVTRQHLVIGGVVVAGERILFSAQIAQNQRRFTRSGFAAAFEHHVFKRVGQTGLARRFVAGANLVPDLRNHHRSAVVFADNNLQAIVEGEFVSRLRISSQCCQRQTNCAEQQACGAAG